MQSRGPLFTLSGVSVIRVAGKRMVIFGSRAGIDEDFNLEGVLVAPEGVLVGPEAFAAGASSCSNPAAASHHQSSRTCCPSGAP